MKNFRELEVVTDHDIDEWLIENESYDKIKEFLDYEKQQNIDLKKKKEELFDK